MPFGGSRRKTKKSLARRVFENDPVVRLANSDAARVAGAARAETAKIMGSGSRVPNMSGVRAGLNRAASGAIEKAARINRAMFPSIGQAAADSRARSPQVGGPADPLKGLDYDVLARGKSYRSPFDHGRGKSPISGRQMTVANPPKPRRRRLKIPTLGGR